MGLFRTYFCRSGMLGLQIALALFLFQPTFAESFETSSMAHVEQAALHLGTKYGPDDVLVVVDLDNTLLTQKQDLGSDQWFDWQVGILGRGASHGSVADSFSTLLDILGNLYCLSSMHPPEEASIEIVSRLQQRGYPVIILTSRGTEFRSATEKALKKNNLNFARSQAGHGYPGTYLPVTEMNTHGLTSEEIETYQVLPSRLVSYFDGVYMTSGQHKGAMLRVLLHRLKKTYPAIVFVDDGLKNVQRLEAAYRSSDVELLTFRYGAVDAQVKAFEESDKEDVKEAYARLSAAIRFAFK